jgi:hypothetical protein
MSGETHHGHRAAQFHRPTGGDGQWLESFFILRSAFAILSNARSFAASTLTTARQSVA